MSEEEYINSFDLDKEFKEFLFKFNKHLSKEEYELINEVLSNKKFNKALKIINEKNVNLEFLNECYTKKLNVKEYNESLVPSIFGDNESLEENRKTLNEIKDRLVDKIFDSFIMNRIHSDYEDMVAKYKEFKKIEKENEELKSFIYFIRNYLDVVKNDQQYFNMYHIFGSRSFNVAVPTESCINEILDRKDKSE